MNDYDSCYSHRSHITREFSLKIPHVGNFCLKNYISWIINFEWYDWPIMHFMQFSIWFKNNLEHINIFSKLFLLECHGWHFVYCMCVCCTHVWIQFQRAYKKNKQWIEAYSRWCRAIFFDSPHSRDILFLFQNILYIEWLTSIWNAHRCKYQNSIPWNEWQLVCYTHQKCLCSLVWDFFNKI